MEKHSRISVSVRDLSPTSQSGAITKWVTDTWDNNPGAGEFSVAQTKKGTLFLHLALSLRGRRHLSVLSATLVSQGFVTLC